MARKGENIYKRKDGRWEGRFILSRKPDGKPKFGYIYATSYSEAKIKLNLAKAEVVLYPSARSPTQIQYSDVLERWLKAAKMRTKESTYSHYLHAINTHILPMLGDIPLAELTSDTLDRFAEDLLTCGRVDKAGGLSAKTVSDLFVIVRSSLRFAKEHGYECSCITSTIKQKSHYTNMRVLSRSEQKKLVSVLLENTDKYKLAGLISLFMGLRIGEVCALQWKDVDLDNCILRVRKTVQRIQNQDGFEPRKTKIIISSPKSECSVRDIPIPDCVKPILIRFMADEDEFVVSLQNGAIIEPRLLQYHFAKHVKQAGIDKTNFHALRHSFATRCVELGFEIKSLSEILGHSNINITLNRYVHSSIELKGKNMNLLSLDG